jgi:hypothetical protein
MSKLKRGVKPLPDGEKRIMVRLSIKKKVLDKIGGEENKYDLLKPEINEENSK